MGSHNGGSLRFGAQLARIELRRLFTTILPEFDHIELAAEPATRRTTIVGGQKTLRIRYRRHS